jgi:hypothetical protein
MALPTTVSSTHRLHNTSGREGPFISSGGNVYVFCILDSTDTVAPFKATDPTSSFSIQTTWDVGTITIESLWCAQESDVIHVVVQISAAGSGSCYYNSWNMADDTWSGVVTLEAFAAQDDVNRWACSIAVRSDGDLLAFYQSTRESIMGQDYQRISFQIDTGSGFPGDGNGTQLTADADYGEEHLHQPVAVMGESDLCHVFFINATLNDLVHNTISSTASVGTVENVDTAIQNLNYPVSNAVYYDDSGTERIAVIYHDESFAVSLGRVTDDATPDTVASVGDNDAGAFSGRSFLTCAVADDGTMHLVYSGGGTNGVDDDLYRDSASSPWDSGDWGTDVSVEGPDAVNIASSTVTNKNIEGTGGTWEEQGQSFTTPSGISPRIRFCSVRLERNGSPTDNVFMRITSSIGGTALGTSNAVAASTISLAGAVIKFTFATVVELSASTKYFLELYRSGSRDSVNYIEARADTANFYASNGTYTKDNGAWSSESANDDWEFRVGITEVTNVSANTYTRSGTERLAIVYDNNGTITYDEVDLAAPPVVDPRVRPASVFQAVQRATVR